MENILSILFRNNYSKYFLEISRQVNWFDYCPPEIPMLSDLRSASTDFSRGDQPSEITKLSDDTPTTIQAKLGNQPSEITKLSDHKI